MARYDYEQVLSRWFWLLALGTLVAMLSSYLAFRYLTPWPHYEATATVIIGVDDPASNPDPDSLQVMRDLAPTYAELAVRRPVTQAVVDALGLPISADDLADLIQVELVTNTPLLEISVTYSEAEQVAAIANEIVRQLAGQALFYTQATSVQLVSAAQAPAGPDLNSYIGTLVGGIMGLLLTMGVVLLIERLDDRIRTTQDVTRGLQLPILGTVKQLNSSKRGLVFELLQLISGSNPELQISTPSPASLAEACQWLCLNVCHLTGDRPRKLLITSPSLVEGKSALAVGLATAWAELGQKIILADAHLRHPALVASTEQAQLAVSSTRAASAAHSRLLTSRQLPAVLDDLATQASVVIVDGLPILSTPNAAILASKVNDILLVLVAGQTRLKAAQEAVEVLTAAGGKILGVVLLS